MRVARSSAAVLEWAGKDGFSRARAEWLEMVRWDTELRPADKVVLSDLGARFGYDRNYAWPSVGRMAAELGVSEPTVKRAISRAVQRGWVICERRGFGGSNHYAMASARDVVDEVLTAHDRRLANFTETRRPSLRSSVIPMGEAAGPIGITGDPSLRSSVIPHSDHPRSLSEITGDPLSLSENPTTEPDHRSLSKGPASATVQDRSQEDWQALADARDDLLERLGEGDVELGQHRAALIGHHRTSHLTQQVVEVGVVGAAEDIRSAIAIAADLEAAGASIPEKVAR